MNDGIEQAKQIAKSTLRTLSQAVCHDYVTGGATATRISAARVVWDIITALRGPDCGLVDDEEPGGLVTCKIKSLTTCRVRRCLESLSCYDGVTVPNTVYIVVVKRDDKAVHHFWRHYNQAIKALVEIGVVPESSCLTITLENLIEMCR